MPALPASRVRDPALAARGRERIAWAGGQMPVLARIAARIAAERPFAGMRIGACLHVTAETANLALALRGAGAEFALCSANPLSVQDDVAAALAEHDGVAVLAEHGESLAQMQEAVAAVLASAPQLALDDGAELIAGVSAAGAGSSLVGATEETTGGLVRARRLEREGKLPCQVLALNEARTERALNDRHGTGQSTLDGIVRAAGTLLAGHTIVVLGYGWAGQGIAERARGAGADVIVCEIDPLRALEARMAGFAVMQALDAAARGDVFITVTGSRGVLGSEHFERMKDGALLANAGHFDVEIDIAALAAAAEQVWDVRPLVAQHRLADGRRLNLLARGRVVNLAAAEGHPAAVMDVSFALQALCAEQLVLEPAAAGVHRVPDRIDREVARLKLEALGVQIDRPTAEQQRYRASWE